MADCVRWERGDDDIVVLTFDDPDHRVNALSPAFRASLTTAVDRLEAERDSIRGVVLTSAKDTFVAGGELSELLEVDRARLDEYRIGLLQLKADTRRFEKLGVPVVAALNGAALGGGYELALGTHWRIVVDDPRAVVGLPEVTLGLLPGGGGVARTVRLLGLRTALDRVLLNGERYAPGAALELGLVDAVVATRDELVPRARAWIEANPDARQRWESRDYVMPGGSPHLPPLADRLSDLAAELRRRSNGSPVDAQHHIVCAATEGALLDLDSAIEVETRYFLDLVVSPSAKNMIRAFWFDMNEIRSRARAARTSGTRPASRIAVIGAGMMGAAIALVSAQAGLDVVLKDVSLDAAEKGKDYSRKRTGDAVAAGRLTEGEAADILARIVTTDSYAPLAECDLVIEAVFESEELKRTVYAEIDAVVSDGTLVASNTSSLPITGLAAVVRRPADFIGLHFFSPVDRMPLLEIVKGAQTSDDALARALEFAARISKTAIVVNDGRGFFTSRVIEKYVYEGMAMLAEGIAPASIEQASRQAGYPVGVLQLCDELNFETLLKIRNETRAGSAAYRRHPAEDVLETMEREGRLGRLRGAGFYEYDASGRRVGLWDGLAELFPPIADPLAIDLTVLIERLLVAEALESARCVEDGVIERAADANIGSILGIGFPRWTGGTVQYINGFEGSVAGFVERADEFASVYGERFSPNDLLRETATAGGRL